MEQSIIVVGVGGQGSILACHVHIDDIHGPPRCML